ncbi:MAG: AMP-binding protein [bacterium]
MMRTPTLAEQRARIEQDQLARLRALVRELVPANPFWTARLAAAGLDLAIPSLAELRRLPLVRKSEIVADHAAHPPFGSNLSAPIADYTRVHYTSGTTAEPLAWPDTAASWQWMLESWKRIFRAAGVARGDRIFFAFSFGPFLGFWAAFDAATQLGVQCLSGGGMSSQKRLHAMVRAQSTVLCSTPTYALHLVETARQLGLDPSALRLRTAIVAGEPGGSVAAVRRAIRAGLGAEVFDHHGMTEVGPVSYQCPARAGTLRILETSYLAEVIDPASEEPVAPGGEGELVLTTLGRAACPMLRYRTGDLVRPVLVDEDGGGEGPHLALAGGVLGRTDDVVIVRGVNVHPSAVDEIVRAVDGVAEYRVQVGTRHAMTELTLEVEPLESAQPELLRATLEERLQRILSLRIPVTLTAAGALPRFELKARRWVRRPPTEPAP